jgi:hypothetical protein
LAGEHEIDAIGETEGIRNVPLVCDAFNVTKVSVEITKMALPSGSFGGPAIGALSLEQTTAYKQYQSPVIVALLVLTCLSLLLRTLFLGNTFQSSDNAELAFKILKNDGSGYWWILREYYGALINVYVKLFVGLLSFFDVVITEFWWKFPIAAIGSLQAPLTYFFLKRRIGCSEIGALAGAAFVSILPIHVFESRYLWGYEVLGVFFVTLAIWKLVDFFETPKVKTGVLASIASGLYLISHGHVIPFLPSLISLVLLFAPSERDGVLNRLRTGMELCLRRFVWVFPLAFFALCVYPVGHALRKPTRLGFYLQDHLPGFIENTGYFLALLLFAGVISLCAKSLRSKFTILFAICGAAYLFPLFFGTPPGITSIRGYMLMGTYFLLLCTIVALDKFLAMKAFRSILIVIISACFFVTSWGTVESIFGRDELMDPSGIKIKRGGIPADPGSKAAGFLVRKYVKNSEGVLALDGSIEPPILFYYFGRSRHSFFDLPSKQAIKRFYELRAEIDVVVCNPDQAPILEADRDFVKRTVVVSEGVPRMLIYTRPHVDMPVDSFDVLQLNPLFDSEYAWSVSLT